MLIPYSSDVENVMCAMVCTPSNISHAVSVVFGEPKAGVLTGTEIDVEVSKGYIRSQPDLWRANLGRPSSRRSIVGYVNLD